MISDEAENEEQLKKLKTYVIRGPDMTFFWKIGRIVLLGAVSLALIMTSILGPLKIFGVF